VSTNDLTETDTSTAWSTEHGVWQWERASGLTDTGTGTDTS
jgi:hypothetical protein